MSPSIAAKPAAANRACAGFAGSSYTQIGMTRCQALRQSRGGSGGGRRQRQQHLCSEDVELFNIDSGWKVEALEDVADLLGVSSDEGWSVEAGVGTTSEDEGGRRGATVEEDAAELEAFSAATDSWDEDDDDLEDSCLARTSGRPGNNGSGAQRVTFNGRVLRPAEQQLLASMPQHMLRQLEAQQREADEERERLKPAARKKAAARLKTHRQLRIISGSAAGRRLISPQGDQTRPMMEMVRNAVFNMIMALYGCSSGLPENTRWLDLFAGTGAVGIEALSRGVGECHFVEMSPWVVSKCLVPNLEACELSDVAVVHTGKAEDFLRRAQQPSQFAGGPFDFMSVCPPYELVDYNEIFGLLHDSPLLHEESIVVVEYPKKLASLVPQQLGPLGKLRDRRYGRTYMAIYGPAAEG